MSEFLQTRRNCAESLRRIAGHIEADTRNTGIVDTTRQVFVIGAYLGLVCADHVGIKAVMGGVTGWDYLLLCLHYNSVCLFLVEGHDAYVYQIMCKKKRIKSKNLEFC